MDKNLYDILLNINEWLKFAEAKNAALIALNAAAIFGMVSILTTENLSLNQCLIYYSYSFILFNLLSLSFALFSFWPQVQCSHNSIEKSENLLFFGDIVNCNEKEYLSKLFDSCQIREEQYRPIDLDYAEQIISNSKIATRKYSFFKIALWLTISAFLSPVFSVISLAIFILKKVISFMFHD
ncbi:Pycsar system effector family protein [Methanosarcina acetivorans]|uniref:Pycsar effector protein domain-containing protein n=1 Tax=Methanosarcina acetivorans (strain ATCC 35395 / DSM 2834 / JCM 12185 / C2A) TaxID=188937 RepID=Q8TQI2_METAC|nr:Pycsar system effector family protein [Methanosarcina acetivorans]AAM04974.1 predicted protein [Methanosarcina acetivorans C2A]